jgi:hypothetical protein
MLAVTKPNAGVLRYLLLSILPLAPLLSGQREEQRAVTVMKWLLTFQLVLVGVIGQYYWVMNVFTIETSPERQLHP